MSVRVVLLVIEFPLMNLYLQKLQNFLYNLVQQDDEVDRSIFMCLAIGTYCHINVVFSFVILITF